jgi:hypothetical protein
VLVARLHPTTTPAPLKYAPTPLFEEMVPCHGRDINPGGIADGTAMAKMAFFLTLGSLIVAGCHLLPRSPPSRSLSACLFAVTAFIGIQGLLSGTMTALGLVPRGPLRDLVEYLADYDGDRPVVLLVGSSFTQQGVDLDVLAETLGNSDRSIAVLPLAIGGLSHLERLHYLKEYLAHAKRMPQLVLFEIAGGYDNGPLFQLQQMRFSDRMVATMDGATAWWAFRWLLGEDVPGSTTRIVLAGEILAHLALHVGHVGFLWNSTRADHPGNYDPRALPPKAQHFTDDEVARFVDRAARTRDLRADWPQTVPTNWMRALLEAEMSILREHGIERFGFYSVPSMQGDNVAYARRFCAAMPNFICIVGEDPQLLAGLQRDMDWYDFDHLHGEGRRLYTRWLGDRLLAQDILP